MTQPYRCKDYQELEIHKSLVDEDSFIAAVIGRYSSMLLKSITIKN